MNDISLSIEDRITRITRFAENLIVLSRGLSDIYPEAEGAVLSVGNAIEEEAKLLLDEYFIEKQKNH